MANTENIEAKLCAYVDGELDAAGRAEIEAHLTANPQHRQLMAELMQQRELLGGLPRERAPEDLFESMQNQLERSVLLDGDAAPGGGGGGAGSPHVAGRINRWPQIFAAAAVLFLAVGLAAVIYFVLPNQQTKYADVTGSGSSAPIARGEASRRIGGDIAETQPTAMARADADRVEAKSGVAAKSAVTDATVDATASSTPTAVAVAPVTPPAAAAAAPTDIFTKAAGNQSKMPGDLAGASTITNVFADAQLNEKLKAAPGVPDNSMLVVVSAENPSATNQQIKDYFVNNGIKWEPAAEPMPEPLELRDSQTVLRSRLNDTRMNLKGGGVGGVGEGQAPPGGAAGAGRGAELNMEQQGYGGFGGGGQASATAKEADAQKQREAIATAQDGAKLDRTTATETEKNFGERSKVADPAPQRPAPYPSRGDGPGSVATDTENNQLREQAAPAPGTSSTGAGAAATAPQVNGKSAAVADATQKGGWQRDDAGGPDQAKRQAPADEAAQAQTQTQSQSPSSPQAAPSAPPAPSQSATTGAPAVAQQQQEEQQTSRQYRQQSPGQQPQLQQQQVNAQSPQTHQVFIARGLTKQQVVAMNSAIANGNRINNYNRAGATITPTTLPNLPAQPAAEAPVALAKKESESKALIDRAAKPGASAPGASAPQDATASPATHPATAPATSESAFFGHSDKNLAAATTTPSGSVASPQSATAPASLQPTTTGAAASDDVAGDERVDVVILVQPEGESAIQQLEQVAPNAAATDASPAPAPAPAPATAPATLPATAPAR